MWEVASTAAMNVADGLSGIDTDGTRLFFCTAGAGDAGIRAIEFDGTGLTTVATLPAGGNSDLVLYGRHAFVASQAGDAVYRVDLETGAAAVFASLAAGHTPDKLTFVNDTVLISSAETGKVVSRRVNPLAFGTNFSRTFANGVHTYTLNNSLTINNNWEEVGFQSDKVVIDGSSNTITINNLNTDALFFGGGRTAADRLEIKNLTIRANADVLSGLLRASGYVTLTNCHLVLDGSVQANGGGLASNRFGNGTYATTDVRMDRCSAVVLGKIGSFAGPLLGFFRQGTGATISNSSAIVLDNDQASGNRTLGSGAGGFVGSGVGHNGAVSITNSAVIFQGSMAHGSGVLAGKFLGSGAAVTLDKLYAIGNIQGVTAPSDSADLGQYPYLLASYSGGPLPQSLTAANVNFLNLGLGGLNMYADDSAATATVAGIGVHTGIPGGVAGFRAAANDPAARAGTSEVTVRIGAPLPDFVVYSPDSRITTVTLGPGAGVS
ncbi:MAG: hypothetical protein ACKONH_00705 [Planctomycetia bacterium]